MARRNGIRTAVLALPLLALPLLAACDDQQSAEKTGQEIGRTVDQTAERVGEAAKGIGAEAGRMMQDAGAAIQQKARDAKDDINRETAPEKP
ncbi:hypothetical protein JJL56_04825 [Azospirillum sp. YIM DDC1]|uniref:YtxH domain-containing protein n=1 Tax=Azospirillum aestuarii TaxID=2802052 RepID=A0ABS1HUV2_9PROT|nr:hypothetical protein [Azospirillum aestuarii]MBK3777038.1 hypothetical protein [Azospirillum brasilense]MBK4718187.1 hypothetical protein [Azospirillum aestuarii]TWA94804.1 hypothetical protein FBY14_10133 [Azospirillum brasilense]